MASFIKPLFKLRNNIRNTLFRILCFFLCVQRHVCVCFLAYKVLLMYRCLSLSFMCNFFSFLRWKDVTFTVIHSFVSVWQTDFVVRCFGTLEKSFYLQRQPRSMYFNSLSCSYCWGEKVKKMATGSSESVKSNH